MVKKRSKKKDNMWPKLAAGLAIAVAVIVLIVVVLNNLPAESTVDVPGEDPTVLVVNDEPIYLSEIEQFRQQFTAQTGQQPSNEEVAIQLVFERVVFQEAERRGISVSREEAEREIELLLAQQGETLENYRVFVESQGVDYEDFLDMQKDAFVFDRLAETLETEPVTDAEVVDMFEMNRQFLGEEATLEEYEALIRQDLEQQKAQNALIVLGQQLIEEANVEVLDERFAFELPQEELEQEIVIQ